MTFFDEADFDDDVFDSGKGSWKQFCVETCYGYWCPVIFDDEVEDVLYEKFKVRAKKINRLVDLAKNNREHARRKLHAIHADINNYFVDREIPNRWKYADLVEFNARWDRWYDGLLLKFENNKFLKKLKRNVQDALVPDIWADAMASEEFEISFLESLIYEMKKRSGWNKPAQKLREDVIDKADEWEDLEDDKLIDILKAWDVDESSPSPLDVFLGMDENDDEDDEDWDDGDD
jgi:hypothetical protein